jgi:hypothetical protein
MIQLVYGADDVFYLRLVHVSSIALVVVFCSCVCAPADLPTQSYLVILIGSIAVFAAGAVHLV